VDQLVVALLVETRRHRFGHATTGARTACSSKLASAPRWRTPSSCWRPGTGSHPRRLRPGRHRVAVGRRASTRLVGGSHLRRTPDGLTITSSRLAPTDSRAGGFPRADPREPFVAGPTVERLALDACAAGAPASRRCSRRGAGTFLASPSEKRHRLLRCIRSQAEVPATGCRPTIST
jgi:hypothetical protein